jgi:hypothetical protein
MKRLVLFLTLAATAAALPDWKGDPRIGAQDLEQQWQMLNRESGALPIRGLLRFAVEAAGLDWHPERVEAALARARAMQDLAPASRTFGNFKWRGDHAGVLDLNAVEFASQLMGLLHLRYRDRLTPAARQQLEQMMTDAVAGLRSHVVRIEYTNIFVMKAWGLIAIGEALGRPDVADDGYRRFDDWLRHTARHGLGEYGAVTYYGIDLDSLGLIARFAQRDATRASAVTAMRLLWTDAAANWWAAGDRLASANSRSYDYLFGRGYFEAHTWTAGWLRERPELEGAGWLGGARENLSTLRDAVAFPPPAEWTEAIRAQVPHTVVQRWGAAPEQRAFAWIGRHVSLAAAGASHSNDERTLVANLGDSPAVPQLTLFMDGRGDPFGTKKTVNAANQAKALHLTPFLATVQRGPEVLQLLSVDPTAPDAKPKAGELSCLLTHLTLPARAEVWFGETRAQPGSPEQPTRVPHGSTISVRLGDAAIAVRFLVAATRDSPAAVEFVEDERGGVARRLTVVHSAAAPKGRATVVAWLRAAEGLDEAAFAAWRRKFSGAPADATWQGGLVKVEVAGENGPLRIEADVARGERRVLAGGEPDALLSVNGRDLGREIMAGFLRD